MARWFWALPVAIGVTILNVLIFVLVMFIYGTFINTGQTQTFYQEMAKKIGPYSSIIVGMPLVFLTCYWFGKKFLPNNSIKAALLVWAIYFGVDLAIIFLSGELFNILLLFIFSFSTKLIAAYLGGFLAQKHHPS
jgi:hypothetical protein